MDPQTTWYILAGALIVIGLLGTILPVLPGLPVMFAGMWLAAWADGYQRIGAGVLVVLGILVAISIAVDFLSSLLGAKRAGASNKGMWGAGIGGFVGIFFGLPGLLAGPLLGAAAVSAGLATPLPVSATALPSVGASASSAISALRTSRSFRSKSASPS